MNIWAILCLLLYVLADAEAAPVAEPVLPVAFPIPELGLHDVAEYEDDMPLQVHKSLLGRQIS